MNRTDALTDRLADGALTDAEAVELEAILAADPGERVRHLALVRLELVLRGRRSEFDLAGRTLERIERERAERTKRAVLSELARRPAPDRHRSSGRRPPLWWGLAALAAALLVGIWFLPADQTPQPPGTPAGPAQPAPEVARLTAVSGTVEVVGPGGGGPARPDQVLGPDETVRTAGDESTAVIEFADRTRVEVHPDTAVRVGVTGGDAPVKVFLLQGGVTAVATGRPVAVGTDAAEAEASRGSFSLYSSGPDTARVEAIDGDVRLVRGMTPGPVALGPGRAAFVRGERSFARVESTPRLQKTPRHHLDFPGALDVAFAADGEVWAASAKQLVRWQPAAGGKPDVRLFAARASNDGAAAVLSADRRTLIAFRGDDKDDRVTVRDLPDGGVRRVVPVRVAEPRFLCAPPDPVWVATVDPKPVAPATGNRVRVWDAATGAERFARDPGSRPLGLAATPDGKYLVVEFSDPVRGLGDRVAFLDAATGEEAFALPTRRRPATALGLSPDGRVMAAAYNGAIQLWDVPGRRLLRTLDGFERVVSRVTFSPNGDLVAAGTYDGQVWVWSVETGRRVQVIETGSRVVRALAFGPDGKLLVTATNKAGVAVWEVAPPPADNAAPDT